MLYEFTVQMRSTLSYPKNGCTALRYALAIDNGVLAPGDKLGWIHKNNATFGASLPDLVLADYTFIILRCPFRRLASAFLDKVVGEVGRRNRFIRAAGGLEDDVTFRRFALAMMHDAVRRSDHHWTPQAEFFVYKHYDDVFCLEDFGDIVRRLKARIGLSVFDVRDKARHGLDQFVHVDGCFADASIDQIAQMRAMGRSPTAAALYDSEILESVSVSFADDVALHQRWGPVGSRFALD